jgi:hypothetical protein
MKQQSKVITEQWRRGGGQGQLPPGARERGRQKRVIGAKEGAINMTNDICPLAPETLAPPL